MGVKIRRVFHTDPASVETEQGGGSFRYLQCVNFSTTCTVFLTWSFSEVLSHFIESHTPSTECVWTAMQVKDLVCSKAFCGCVQYAVMQDCFWKGSVMQPDRHSTLSCSLIQICCTLFPSWYFRKVIERDVEILEVDKKHLQAVKSRR